VQSIPPQPCQEISNSTKGQYFDAALSAPYKAWYYQDVEELPDQ
jgi:hypothetical protein